MMYATVLKPGGWAVPAHWYGRFDVTGQRSDEWLDSLHVDMCAGGRSLAGIARG